MNAIQQIIGWMPALLQATGVTLALSVTSVLTALVLAVFLASARSPKTPYSAPSVARTSSSSAARRF